MQEKEQKQEQAQRTTKKKHNKTDIKSTTTKLLSSSSPSIVKAPVEIRERRTNIATLSPEQKQEQTHEQDHQEQAQERPLLHLTTIEIEFGDSKEAGLCFPIVVEESKSMVSSVISSMTDVYLPAALSSSSEDDAETISM
jgi:iron-sulfur cluster repair protein YtfE (RIC family)